jgi:hypothetical protein
VSIRTNGMKRPSVEAMRFKKVVRRGTRDGLTAAGFRDKHSAMETWVPRPCGAGGATSDRHAPGFPTEHVVICAHSFRSF